MAGTTVDTTRARQHLEYLVAHETSRKRISTQSGVARQTIIGILQGKTLRIAPQTEQQLLAVTAVREPIPAGHVDALGSRRRVRALIATGHPVPVIAAKAGLSMAVVAGVAAGKIQTVTPVEATALARAFTALELVVGRSPGARRLGAARRWALPLEWDEDDLDDPHARPCKVSKARQREITSAGIVGVVGGGPVWHRQAAA